MDIFEFFDGNEKLEIHRNVEKRSNIVDDTIAKLEILHLTLGILEEKRKNQLRKERQMLEELIISTMPAPVADQLLRYGKVESQSFDNVTIFFSDIVGYTKRSAESSEEAIKNMLNVIYNLFDSVVEQYEVYKIETIGDAYVAVAGCPKWSDPSLHCQTMCQMALHLLSAFRDLTTKDPSLSDLKIRIGLHTGNVVAGVVGHLMPRYCLFGDAVNTCSRMESTSEPMEIHISKSVVDMLTDCGTKPADFRIEKRKPMEIKGKGKMQTYWLKEKLSEEDSKSDKNHGFVTNMLKAVRKCWNGRKYTKSS